MIPVEVFDIFLILEQKLYIRREKSKFQDIEVNFIIQTAIIVCMSFKELIKRCFGRGKACKKKYINVKISVKIGGYIQVTFHKEIRK